EVLWVNLATVDGREDAEAVVCESHVVAVGGSARGDDSTPVALAHERGVEGLYELLLFGHAPNPAVGFNRHELIPSEEILERPRDLAESALLSLCARAARVRRRRSRRDRR